MGEIGLFALSFVFVLGNLVGLTLYKKFNKLPTTNKNIEDSIEFLRKEGFNIYAPGYKKE